MPCSLRVNIYSSLYTAAIVLANCFPECEVDPCTTRECWERWGHPFHGEFHLVKWTWFVLLSWERWGRPFHGKSTLSNGLGLYYFGSVDRDAPIFCRPKHAKQSSAPQWQHSDAVFKQETLLQKYLTKLLIILTKQQLQFTMQKFKMRSLNKWTPKPWSFNRKSLKWKPELHWLKKELLKKMRNFNNNLWSIEMTSSKQEKVMQKWQSPTT